MDFYLIETKADVAWNREVLGIYVDGFVNKQLLLDTYNEQTLKTVLGGVSSDEFIPLTIEDVKYQWCTLEEDSNGEVYSLLSDKEEAGSFGVTAIYW
jgi:hypothetical protein